MFQKLRRTFIAGILAAAPIVLTVYILLTIFKILDKPTARLLKQFDIEIPGLGIIITILLILLLGSFVTNVLGKRLFGWGERILAALPIVNTIYKNIKQIMAAFSGGSTRAFKQVVYIEYPRRGLWTMAFVTGESTNEQNIEFYHIFVPTTPNPTSGYYLIVPKQDTVIANLKVEEGLRTIISGGMLAPRKMNVLTRFKSHSRPVDDKPVTK